MSPPLKVFISYARKDADLRAEFEVHLTPLKRDERIIAWHDGQIRAGTEWEAEIQRQLQEAVIILLLVSPDFLNSKYIWENELKQAMERHDRDEARVIPILLRPAFWKKSPLSKIKFLPRDAKPIITWTHRDEAFVSVIEGIDQAIEELIDKQTKNNSLIINIPVAAPVILPIAENPSFSFEVIIVNSTGGIIKGPTKSVNYYQELLGNGINLDMVEIPAGSFLMGSVEGETGLHSNEKPQHRVTVPAFLMGKYPVTQAQWTAVAKFPKMNIDLNPDPSRFKGLNLPVESVSWYEAEEFCARLSKQTGKAYRLPSEAEWEYACRAGTTTPFYFGETITTDLANYDQNKGKTTEVGSFPANEFGMYDMHGNVWEWCADHWHSSYEGAPTNGSAWLSIDKAVPRLLRGGSWGNDPQDCRSAARAHYGSGGRYRGNGFRCSIAFGNAS